MGSGFRAGWVQGNVRIPHRNLAPSLAHDRLPVVVDASTMHVGFRWRPHAALSDHVKGAAALSRFLRLTRGSPLRYAEMDKATKNSISHRYRALDKLRQHLIAVTKGAAAGGEGSK